MKKITALFLITLLAFPALLFAAQKTVKLTTYYPAPYGEYKQLKAAGSDGDNGTVALQASGSAGTGLVVTNANNVGIGTADPQAKLDVMGNAQVSGVTKTTGGLVLETRNSEPAAPVEVGRIWIQN